MSTGSLLLGAAVLVLVGLFLARPFLLANAKFSRKKGLRQELVAEKEGVLAQIEVLEFDYETGTLPETDYRQQRQALVASAAETLKRLDAQSDLANPSPDAGLEPEIEAAVARLRQRRSPRPVPAPKKASPQQPSAAPKKTTPQKTAASSAGNGRVNYCSQCGKPVEEEDNFCAYCGAKIVQPQSR